MIRHILLWMILALSLAGKAQTYSLTQVDSRWELVTNSGDPVSLPANVAAALRSGAPVTSLSPDQEFLVFQDGESIHILVFATGQTHKLMSLLPDNESQSGVAWALDEQKGRQTFAFVNQNKAQYKNGSKVFILRMKGAELEEKLKFDIAINHAPGLPPEAGEDFYFEGDLNFIYQNKLTGPGEPYHREIDLHFPKRLQAQGKAFDIVPIGYEASTFYYDVLDKNYIPIKLPPFVHSTIRQNGGEISPDGSKIVFDHNQSIMLYDFVQDKVMQLYMYEAPPEGLHPFLWNSAGTHFAYVDINQQKYGARLFVMEFANGRKIAEQWYDIPINFTCGSMCTSEAGEDFWWITDQKIGYLYHQAMEENEGKKGEITLK